MPYLRVDCFICKASWNYYDVKWQPYPTTAVDILGCVCPNCGGIGFIQGGASDKTNGQLIEGRFC